MGMLVEGRWTEEPWKVDGEGRFQRQESAFRRRVTADGAEGFRAEPGRYHLYVAHACPWAHRTLIWRALKGLEDAISVSYVEPEMLEGGWRFGAAGDGLYGLPYLADIYRKAKPDYTGRVTVPVLWDKRTETAVSNESAEIVRMLDTAFDAWGRANVRLYAEPHRAEIDRLNARIYERVNNGVYRAGFARTQKAYEEAFDALFAELDWLEERLAGQRYLVGDAASEADWRLFPTLLRFDPVYVGHFKCNQRRIADYPSLSNYLRELWQTPGIAATFDVELTKRHYYASHLGINPTGIVPKGPALDLDRPHDRGRFASAR